MLECDVKPDTLYPPSFPTHLYTNIQKGDIVWIRTAWLDAFVEQILPTITKPFILVSGDADDSIPYHHKASTHLLLKSPHLIKWFTQNLDIAKTKHTKLEYLPIGLDFHTLTKTPDTFQETQSRCPAEQEESLFALLKTLPPTTKRIPKVYYDAHLVESTLPLFRDQYGYSRTSIAKILSKKGSQVAVLQNRRIPQHLYFKEKSRYAFSLCVYGAGLDTHRTWENLILGHIVIMKSTTLDPLFKDLPVVIIDSFDEITEKNLRKWLATYGDVFNNPAMRHRLTHRYWMAKIRSYQKIC